MIERSGRIPAVKEMTPTQQEMLRQKLFDRMQELLQHDVHELLRYAYRGTYRPDGTRVSWDPHGWQCWIYLQEDLDRALRAQPELSA